MEFKFSNQVVLRKYVYPNKKKLQKNLKLSSQNETNSLVKLKNAAPKMELVGCKFFKGKFGLTAAKSRATKRVLEDELARVGAVEVEERSQVLIVWFESKLNYFQALANIKFGKFRFVPCFQNFKTFEV